jgi:hypothetical protein
MSHSRSRRAAVLAAGALSLAALAAPAVQAAPATKFTRVAGLKVAGTPAKYDKVGVLQIGSAKAKNILVLNPGTSASAAYFAPLARSIVQQAPDWQVWSVERRENLLEDQSVIDQAKAGKATPQQLFDYYLGWINNKSITNHFAMIPDASVAYAKQWGMSTEIQDLRVIVKRAQSSARRLHGKVVVGGHSLGGTITSAYATWDFGGRAGANGLAGLLFIDGGSGPTPVTPAAARDSLSRLDAASTSPWLQFGGIPAPFTGLFNSTGSLGALLDPNAPSLGQASGLLPANIVPAQPVTNVGQYGYALDVKTSPPGLAAAQAHLGTLGTGNPAGWDDTGALTPIRRMADVFSGWGLKGLDGTAWYHPLRLTMDAGAVAAGNRNAAQRVLDVHATHGRDLPRDLKMYAFGAALGGQRVLDATKALARQSHIPSKNLTLVDRHTTYAHNDPNTADPSKNDFLKRLIPWLRSVAK